MATFTWMFAEKVIDIRAAGTGTFDLRQPVWIYYFVAWIGLASAVLLLVLRTVRLGDRARQTRARRRSPHGE